MIRLLIFDFDGTLVHTAPDICNAVNEFLELNDHPHLSSEEIVSHIGMGLGNLVDGVFPEAQSNPEFMEKVEKQFLEIYDRHCLKLVKPFDGAMRLLESWPHKLAIVSNKKEYYVRKVLKHLKMDHLPWSCVLGGDSKPYKKPSPQILHDAIEAAGVTPSEALMVGDGYPDVGAAKAAGIPCVAVQFGYTKHEELITCGATHSIANLLELERLVERLNVTLQPL